MVMVVMVVMVVVNVAVILVVINTYISLRYAIDRIYVLNLELYTLCG